MLDDVYDFYDAVLDRDDWDDYDDLRDEVRELRRQVSRLTSLQEASLQQIELNRSQADQAART